MMMMLGTHSRAAYGQIVVRRSVCNRFHERLIKTSLLSNDRNCTSFFSTTSRKDEEEKEEKVYSVREKGLAWMELSKAKLSMLVVSTSAFGYLAAGSGGDWQYTKLWTCAMGTALCSSSAASFNQIFEVDRDRKMKRTAHRPLVKGVLQTNESIAFATMAGVTGTSLLYVGTDAVTASLGMGNIVLYAGLYTHLKPRSEINTWVGAVVGAIPPLMGYSAATNGDIFTVDAALLASTLYLWQFPHFFALSWMHRQDYARGGFQMVPVNDTHTNGDRTSHLITKYTLYLSTLPFISTALEVTTPMFAMEGVALNAYALHVARKFHKSRSNADARRVFFTSLWYLPSFMVLYLLHSKTWKQTDENDENNENNVPVWKTYVHNLVHDINEKGRQLCLHEQVIVNNNHNNNQKDDDMNNKCPIQLGKVKAQQTASDISQVVVATTTNPPTTTSTSQLVESAK